MASFNAIITPIPEIIIIGDFGFPYGDAGANLLRGHCAALLAAGFTVGMLPKVDRCGKLDDSPRIYKNVKYWEIPLTKPPLKYWHALENHFCLNDPRFDWLEKSDLKQVKAIIAYPGICGATAFIYRLSRLCHKHGIKLFCHVVEWFDWKHLSKKHAWLSYADSEFHRRVAMGWTDGIISISDYLQAYYTRKGLKSVCIPPLLDLTDPKWHCDSDQPDLAHFRPLRLLFSGTYKRDRHDIILRSLLELRQSGAEIVLDYLGPTREQIQQAPGVGADLLNALGTGVHYHGFVSDPKAVARLTRSASFGIILRDDLRWSQACFPSKVPEFNALGVPMISNISSDLGRYLQDGENSLVCPAVTVDALCATLRRAWALTEAQFNSMKLAARQTAEMFEARNFAETYRKLIG
jgi:glycosyltransferase involved in cell wall biosynthesis